MIIKRRFYYYFLFFCIKMTTDGSKLEDILGKAPQNMIYIGVNGCVVSLDGRTDRQTDSLSIIIGP